MDNKRYIIRIKKPIDKLSKFEKIKVMKKTVLGRSTKLNLWKQINNHNDYIQKYPGVYLHKTLYGNN